MDIYEKGEITNAGKINIGTRKITVKKPWETEEILQLIDEKRKYKNVQGNSGIQKYKSLRNEISRKCREPRRNGCRKNVKKLKMK